MLTRLELFLSLQNSWLVTTMKISTCLTPTTVMGQTIAEDIRDTAIMLQVLNSLKSYSNEALSGGAELYKRLTDWLWFWVSVKLSHSHCTPAPSPLLFHSKGGELLWATQWVCGQRQWLWTHLPVGQVLRSHRPVYGRRQRRSGESDWERAKYISL